MKVHHFHKSVYVCKRKYVKLCTYEIQYRYFCPVWGSAKRKKKQRKRYVYWCFRTLVAWFPCGNAIFASDYPKNLLQNRISKNPVLHKTLILVGFGCVKIKPPEKIPIIGIFFGFFGRRTGGTRQFGPKIRRRGGPLPQKKRPPPPSWRL